MLEVDGKFLNQSSAILRFIGTQTGAYDTSDPFAMWAADAALDTIEDFNSRGPKNDEGRPLMYGMFGDDVMSPENVAKLVEHRVTSWAGMQTLLGDKTFFGGVRPPIADFSVAASLFSLERNTQGKASQAHVHAAYAESLAGNATMTAYADRIGAEFVDYLATRLIRRS